MPAPRHHFLAEPDYHRPLLAVTPAQRARILAPLAVLYGRQGAERCWAEVERLMQVHHAHRTPAQLAADAAFDPRERFTEHDVLGITYGDLIQSPGVPPLQALNEVLTGEFAGAFTALHLLPFFPYSSDRGFSVLNYEQVDPRLGDWGDIARLGERFRLMFDGVINHVSSRSPWFREFLNGHPYYGRFFVSFESPHALTAEQRRKILRPRTSELLTGVQTLRGPRWVWTTFSADQVDLNYGNPDVLTRVLAVLLLYVRRGADLLRLDAATYLWREPGTPSAHLPQTHAIIKVFRAVLDVVAPRVALVTETNVPHQANVSYFGDGDDEAHLVYNFALPPLVLWSFHAADCTRLARWASALKPPSPTTAFLNFLDSHDGVGLLGAADDLLASEQAALVQRTLDHGGLVSYRTAPDGSRQPYELNIPWYNALNRVDGAEPDQLQVDRFIASRAIALAIPGVAAVYLPSIIGAHVTGDAPVDERDPRSINRNTIHMPHLRAELADPASHAARIRAAFVRLLQLRTRCPALHPAAPHRVLAADPAVFALLRAARDGAQALLALVNVSPSPRTVTLAADQLAPHAGGRWHDLVGERDCPTAPGGLTLALAPYQVAWLEHRQP